MSGALRKVLHSDVASGVLIFLAALAAMVSENSSWSPFYDGFLNLPVAIQFGGLIIAKPLLLWINDGLMAVFFLLVGLELKREFLIGHLAQPAKMVLPLVGALGWIVVPAAIFTLFNLSDPEVMNGWASS